MALAVVSLLLHGLLAAGVTALADTQETAPCLRTAICLDDLTGNYSVECGKFHLDINDGNIPDMYKLKADIINGCVIPKSRINSTCEVTRTDGMGKRERVNVTVRCLDDVSNNNFNVSTFLVVVVVIVIIVVTLKRPKCSYGQIFTEVPQKDPTQETPPV